MPGGPLPPNEGICDGVMPCVQWQFGRTADKNIAKHVNNTKIIDPVTGGLLTPFELWTPDESGALACEVHNCRTGDPTDEPCLPWVGTTLPWQVNPTNPGINTYTPSGTTNFSRCFKNGFKNVQAHRQWHGSFGWTSGDAQCPDTVCNGGPSNGGKQWQSYQPVPDQTKYLAVTYDVHVRNTFAVGDDAGGSLSVDKTGTRQVDWTSGKISSTLNTTETNIARISGILCTTFFSNGGAGYSAGDCTSPPTHFAKGMVTTLDNVDTDLHCGFPLLRPDDPTLLLPDLIVQWNNGTYAGGITTTSGLPPLTDLNNYAGADTGVQTGGGTTYGVNLSFTRTNTTVTWDFTLTDNLDGGAPGSNTYHYYGTVTLSQPNPSNAVYTDIKGLLSAWPLNNDVLYPWRSDGIVSVSPLMSRLERAANVIPIGFNTATVDDLESPIADGSGNPPFSMGWAPTYNQRPWFDDTCYLWQWPAGHTSADSAASALILMFDGSIKGAPNPGGYSDYFDFYFNDWVGCCFTDPGSGTKSWDWYQLGWGMFLSQFITKSGAQLPMNCTQWVDFFESSNKPQGAYLFCNDQSNVSFPSDCPPPGDTAVANNNSGLWGCKYAEVLDPWYTQNFARPGGADKFIFDETRVYCAANAGGAGPGSTWNITNFDTSIPPNGTDFTGVWGGPVVGGFYKVASYAGGVLTLGALLFKVPTGWTSASGADDVACFGKLRFPTAPSLLGRVQVSSVHSMFTFQSPQPNFGLDAGSTEIIDIFDSDMNMLSPNTVAGRIDDTHFTIAGEYPTAAWVMISGSPKWYMNDDSPKGWYGVLEWLSDLRSNAEYTRLTGITDCSSTQVARPAHNAGGGPVGNLFAQFSQTNACLPFESCDPRVVCISPNAEAWNNGITYQFPDAFTFDDVYGSKWWGWVQATMTDLLWQAPHKPCGFDNTATTDEDQLSWLMDSGVQCPDDFDELTIGPTIHHKFYANAPQVEARFAVPCKYGLGQNECGPPVPAGIQIGWSSPVTAIAGDIAFPPVPPGITDSGVPLPVNTAYIVHANLCLRIAANCRFNYRLPGCGPSP